MIIRTPKNSIIKSEISGYDDMHLNTCDNLITSDYIKKFENLILENSNIIYPDFIFITASCNNSYATMRMIETLITVLNGIPKIVIIDNGTYVPLHSVLKKYFKIIDNYNFKIFENAHDISRNHGKILDYTINEQLDDNKFIIVCDNDILYKPKLKKLLDFCKDYDNNPVVYCNIDDSIFLPPARIEPTFMIINSEKYKENDLSFYDPERCKIHVNLNNNIPILNNYYNNYNNKINGAYLYDTGASLLEDILIKKLKIEKIKLSDYVVHFKGLSYNLKPKTNNSYNDFILNNKSLLTIF